MYIGLKTRITPCPEGYHAWVLIQTEFCKEWRSAASILKEEQSPIARAEDAEKYAEKARKAVR